MNLTISGHHLKVTEGLRGEVLKGLKLLEARLAHATAVVVRLTGKRKNGGAQGISIAVRMPGRKVVTVRQRFHDAMRDFYETVETALRKLNEQLGRHKRRMRSYRQVPSDRMVNAVT